MLWINAGLYTEQAVFVFSVLLKQTIPLFSSLTLFINAYLRMRHLKTFFTLYTYPQPLLILLNPFSSY